MASFGPTPLSVMSSAEGQRDFHGQKESGRRLAKTGIAKKSIEPPQELFWRPTVGLRTIGTCPFLPFLSYFPMACFVENTLSTQDLFLFLLLCALFHFPFSS